MKTAEEHIAEALELPESYELDGERQKSRSIGEVIEGLKYLSRRKAGANPFGALHRTTILTQGPER